MPALRDTSRIAGLTPDELASKWMHPAMLECSTSPLLWELAEWANLRVCDVTKRLLVAMLRRSHSNVQGVGQALVIQLKMWEYLEGSWVRPAAEVSEWAPEPAGGQAVHSLTPPEALQKAEQWYASLELEEQYEVRAVALFQNPPVVDRGTSTRHSVRYMNTDWPSRTYKHQPRYALLGQSHGMLPGVMCRCNTTVASMHEQLTLHLVTCLQGL
jgi:hypothetical protein